MNPNKKYFLTPLFESPKIHQILKIIKTDSSHIEN